MADSFNTLKNAPGVIAKAAAQMLADELQFTKSIAQADESDYDGKNGYSAGDTVYISKPARFTPGSNLDITSAIQDITEEKAPLTLNIVSTVGVDINSLQYATEIQIASMLKRVIKPAVSAIAQDVERQMLVQATQSTYNLVGTPGSTIFDPDTVLSAREKMNKFLTPKDDNRFTLFDSTAGRSAVNARKGLFQSSSEIANQYKQGWVGMADGFKWLENELLYQQTTGTRSGAHTVTTTSTTGATTIAITGTGTQTITKGDVFTIAGVFAVHPITKVAYPFLQQFVATATATATAGAYTVSINPTIYGPTSGSLQNVSALPQSTAVVTFVGTASTTYTQNLAFHKEAFRMVSVPLVMPTAVEFAAQETVDGVTVAIVRAFDVLQRRMITRLDFLGGLANVRNEWAARITS